MRKLVFVSIIAGLILSLSAGYLVRDYSYEIADEDAGQIGLCTGANPFIDGHYKFTYGVPFKWQSGDFIKKIETCNPDSIPKPTGSEVGIHYIVSWQLYANWLIFSMPILLIAYVTRKRYAHNRY